MQSTLNSQTLSQAIWPTRSNRLLREIFFIVAGSVVLTLSAKISIPALPVPFTLQTLVVLLIGFTYGPKLASYTIGLYLLQGAMGLPVFQGAVAGLAYMAGPTGGYLIGFFFAALLCGKLAQMGWDKRFITMAIGMVLGNLVIYAFGLVWLGSVIGWDKPILQFGMVPFLAGDAIKIIIAVGLVPTVWKKVNQK